MATSQLNSESSKSTVYGEIGLAIFIILFGVVYLLPSPYIPEGSLFLAAGTIILTVSCIKWFKSLDVDWFDIVFGAIFLINGINKVFQLGLGILPALIVVFGVVSLVDAIRTRHSTNQSHDAPSGSKL